MMCREVMIDVVTTMTLRDSVAEMPDVRPSRCPFCHGRALDTLAKMITASTMWRCRTCEKTWTGNGTKQTQQHA